MLGINGFLTATSKRFVTLFEQFLYFFLIIQETDIASLWNFEPDAGISMPELFVLLLYPITVITAVISLALMIHAVMTREYAKIDAKEFYTGKVISRTKEQFAAIVANYYLLSIEENKRQNNRKAKEYQSGWVFGVVSLVYFFLYTSIASIV